MSSSSSKRTLETNVSPINGDDDDDDDDDYDDDNNGRQ